MARDGSAPKSLTSFWQRSKDKLSPSNNVKFMPIVTNPGNDKYAEDPAAAALSAKQHRRAQVRKAQIEHRQRKANFVKHLEQDVIDLREMISTTEIEASTVKHENDAIRKVLLKASIPVTSLEQQEDPFVTSYENQQLQPPNFLTTSSNSQENSPWHSDSSLESLMSITFDPNINASCLHMDPLNTYKPSPEIINSPDIFTTFSSTTPQAASSSSSPPRIKPTSSKASLRDEEQDLSTAAVNFILALEHPCRTHFHPHPQEFNPTGSPSGHELMASTHLYTSAPPSIFPNLDSASWHGSGISLLSLHALSQSLPKGDFEITPVQAWFMLSERFGARRLLEGESEGRLKRGLGRLVRCFEFGAVMEEGAFWEVVEGVFGVGKYEGGQPGGWI